ncbi:MAG: VTT domain-containing protein, partial [Thermodesulfobacteriota bacterium]
FALARWFGLPFVERMISPRIIKKYDYFMEHRGLLVTFILFVIPGFPKDALSYLIGLSHMKTASFLVVCTTGRLLGTLMLSISGNYARNDQNYAVVIILGISALILLLAYFYHDELLALVRKKRDTV